MKEKVRKIFTEYYQDETMPVIEMEDKFLNLIKIELLSQLELLSEYITPQVYTKTVIEIKNGRGC
jgi:hypothetical protein